ncbi:hypothetical protein Golax_025832, partial [Gossypium laxum]|nr:hypothetical protein [Gossypium laxum]
FSGAKDALQEISGASDTSPTVSFSLLLPPSSTTNTHLTVKERNEVIHRNLGGGKPTPCPPHDPRCHGPSGRSPCRPHSHGCYPHVGLTPNHGKYCRHPSHC